VNPAYTHLRDRLRIGELTVPQIVSMFCGFMGGMVWALYLSPFSPYLTLFTAIYLACLPAGTVLLASSTEFDLWLYMRACAREAFTDGRFTAGAGEATDGYSITADAESGGQRQPSPARLELGDVWGD
jgi:hypothetical protein